MSKKIALPFVVRFRVGLASRLLNSALRLQSPFLVGLVCAGIARPLNGRKRYRVLAVWKDNFEEDVRALSEFSGEIQYLSMHVGLLKQIFYAVARDDISGLKQHAYHQPGPWDQAKRSYYDFLMRMLPVFMWATRIDAVLTCNFAYIALQEASRAFTKLGVPYVVLYKEGMNLLPERRSEWVEHYKIKKFSGPVYAARILTVNKTILEALSATNLPGLSKDILRATGLPRVDFLRHMPTNAASGKSLVFFAFDPAKTFPYFKEVWGEDNVSAVVERLRQRLKECYRDILAFAEKHPDVQVVIKSKSAGSSLKLMMSAVTEILGGSVEECGYPNLTITNSLNAQELIRGSTAVISLNSTTGLEAVVARKPLLTPDFESFFPNKAWDLFASFPELSVTFRSMEDIERCVFQDMPASEEYESARDACLKHHLATAGDEFSTREVERNLLEVIELNVREAE